MTFKLFKHQQDGYNFAINNQYPGTLFWHEMGCIYGDATIKINRGGCSRKYKLSEAYEKFHNTWRKDIPSMCRSYKDDHIGLNEIKNIIESGVKETWVLRTKNKDLRLTSDHEVMTDRGYVPCSELKVGDKVMVDSTKKHQKKRNKTKRKKPRYNLRYVGPYYPYGHETTMRGKKIRRAEVHILSYYADVYGFSLDMFIQETYRPDFEKLYKIKDPKKYHVHHKDHDHKNNNPDNLELLCAKEHNKHHGNRKHFGHGEPEFEQVESVEYFGKEMTYDLVMKDPHRNFVANDIVVHNCGKTLTSLIVLRHILNDLRKGGATAPRILVLLPKSMLHQWKKETLKFAPDIYQSITYLPYSQLKKATELVRYFDFRTIVMDESHYMKTQGTNRTHDFCKLLEAIGNSPGQFQGGRYLALSGTPMLNHAAELYTTWALLTSSSPFDASSKMLDKVRYEKWKRSFTKTKLKSWKTKYGTKYGNDAPEGVQNEHLFNQLIGPVVHYRRAADCLDLPNKQEIEIDLGLDDDKLLQDAEIDKPEAYMAVLERLAQAKTPHALDWIDNFLKGSSEQLVVFCPYKNPLYKIADKFKNKFVMVTGDQNDHERQEAMQIFQEGKKRIFLTTYRAGGVGLNLQNAHNSLYLGYPWTPGDVKQAMARTHRQGQINRTLHYFLTSGENDSRIFGLIRSKEEAISAVEDGLLAREQQVSISVDSFI